MPGRSLRRRCGLSGFLTFYLNLDYQTVAERDWHASLCVVLGLLMLQAWPGRTSRIVSALLAAIALTIRPHVLLFLPAFCRGDRRGDRATGHRAGGNRSPRRVSSDPSRSGPSPSRSSPPWPSRPC